MQIDERRDDAGAPPVNLGDAPGLALGIVELRRSRRRSGVVLLLVAVIVITMLIVGLAVGAGTNP